MLASWVKRVGFFVFFVSSVNANTIVPNVPPQTIAYQGFLTSSSGVPLNGAFNVTFRLYADAVGGSPLWEETHSGVSVNAGHFFALLGSQLPLSDDPDLRGHIRRASG